MLEPLTIAHLSDLHCGAPHFVPDLMERAIAEINDLKPDIVVCSGDLTTFGFKEEYAAAKRYLDRIECEALVVIPGNHDSRNVGYVHFEELFGERNSVLRRAASRSSPSTRPSPTSTTARSAAGATAGSRSSSPPSRPTSASSCCTTTCCRSPARAASATSSTTPATRSSACSARACTSCSPGHKHVPYAWKLENLFVVNTGTVSTLRLRGNTRPCYNVIEVTGTHVAVWRRYPFHGQERIIQFDLATGEYEKYTGRIEREVTAKR